MTTQNSYPDGAVVGKSRTFFYALNDTTRKAYYKKGGGDLVKGYALFQKEFAEDKEKVATLFTYIKEETTLSLLDVVKDSRVDLYFASAESARNSIKNICSNTNGNCCNVVHTSMLLKKILKQFGEVVVEAEHFYNNLKA